MLQSDEVCRVAHTQMKCVAVRGSVQSRTYADAVCCSVHCA